jgi:hypothetical protein
MQGSILHGFFRPEPHAWESERYSVPKPNRRMKAPGRAPQLPFRESIILSGTVLLSLSHYSWRLPL